MDDLKAWLTTKWGPLPVWAWLVGGLVLAAVLL